MPQQVFLLAQEEISGGDAAGFSSAGGLQRLEVLKTYTGEMRISGGAE